jgi:hypothetical protein
VPLCGRRVRRLIVAKIPFSLYRWKHSCVLFLIGQHMWLVVIRFIIGDIFFSLLSHSSTWNLCLPCKILESSFDLWVLPLKSLFLWFLIFFVLLWNFNLFLISLFNLNLGYVIFFNLIFIVLIFFSFCWNGFSFQFNLSIKILLFFYFIFYRFFYWFKFFLILLLN